MTHNALYVLATLLILLGLVLIVVGLGEVAGLGEMPILWRAGLAAVALAMILSLATRWIRG